MTDWVQVVSDTLESIGGREVCVSGAKLHTAVSRVGWKKGEDFSEYLRSRDVSFSEFLEQTSGLTIHRPAGTDILVGFTGAEIPLQATRSGPVRTESASIRRDVYEAFTRIGSSPFAYLREKDQFLQDPGESQDAITVPRVTLDDQIELRREFGSAIQDDGARSAILDALEGSPNPLASFQRAVNIAGVSARWHDFKQQSIAERVVQWANDNGVEPSPAWFRQRIERSEAQSPQLVLADLAAHMTDEEIRNLQIPFRAVEEMYRALPRRR